jgi:hypothetical protein
VVKDRRLWTGLLTSEGPMAKALGKAMRISKDLDETF